MKKRRLIIILFISLFMFISAGISSWIIINQTIVNTKYDPHHTLAYYFEDNQETTYNAEGQLPQSKENGNLVNLEDRILTFSYKTLGSVSSYTVGAPENAGSYTVKIEAADSADSKALFVTFTIKKATPVVNNAVSVVYNQGARTNYFTTSMSTSAITYNGSFKHDGKNIVVPGTISYSDSKSKLEVGTSNYQYTFTPSSSNYESVSGTTSITTYATVNFQTKNTTIPSIEVQKNSTITEPSFTPSVGYEVSGWKYNNTAWNFSTNTVTNDMTLVANETPIVYTITYILDGGTVTGNPTTYTIESADIHINNPTKTGVTFDGWSGIGITNTTKNLVITRGSYGNKTFTANWKHSITVEYSNSEYTYDGTAKSLSAPSVYVDGVLSDSLPSGVTISYSYTINATIYVEGSVSDINSMINAGVYNITVTASLTDSNGVYALSDESNLTPVVTINRKQIKLKTLEMNYDASKRNWTQIKSTLANNIAGNFLNGPNTDDEGGTTGPFPLASEISLFSISDNVKTYSTQSNYDVSVPGSTYILSFDLYNFNYAIYDIEEDIYNEDSSRNYISGSTLFKYKTALSGSTYYTIEDALTDNTTNTIKFAGDSSTESSYVVTEFSSLPSTITGYPTNFALASSRSMVVPYNSDGTESSTSTSASSGNVYSALIIKSGISLELKSSSTLTIAAIIGFAQPNTTITCTRGVLMNYGTITAKSGSNIKCYGYLKGGTSVDDGLLILESGSTTLDCMHTYDWPGGTTATALNSNNVFPANAWSMHNISCTTKIIAGATYKAFLFTSASNVGASAEVHIIAPDSSVKGGTVFIANSGYAIKRTSYPNNWGANHASATALYSITGSNQIAGQKDIIEINGEFIDSSLSTSASGVTIKTSPSISLPISYLSIILNSGSNLSLKKSDYLFLPGTSLTIMPGAELSTSSGVDLSFETMSHISQFSEVYSFSTHCKETNDAYMMNNGTVSIGGNIGGEVKTSVVGAKFTITGNPTSSFISLWMGRGSSSSKGGVAYKVTNFYARGLIGGQSTYAFTKSSYTSYNVSSNVFAWSGAQGTNSNLDGSINQNAVQAGGSVCIVEGTLVTMADGSKKAIEDIEVGELVLTFCHETGTFEAKPLIDKVHKNTVVSTQRIINLQFEDNSVLRISYEHGLFDLTTMKYEFINENNVSEFVNHMFASVDTMRQSSTILGKKLVSYTLTDEVVRIYSPVSEWNINVVTNDLLTMAAMMVNFFEYDENLQYNQELYYSDIEKYGLFTYEEFASYMTYEEFKTFPIEYFKVAIGKGYMTYEDLIYLLDYDKSY